MSEENKKISEEEILQNIDQLKNQMGKNAPEDIAAAFFKLEYPRFRNNLNLLSHRALQRVLTRVVAGPLAHFHYEGTSEIENGMVYLCNEMIRNVVIMQLHTEMQKAEETIAKELQNKENSANLSEETNKGENNGSSTL